MSDPIHEPNEADGDPTIDELEEQTRDIAERVGRNERLPNEDPLGNDPRG